MYAGNRKITLKIKTEVEAHPGSNVGKDSERENQRGVGSVQDL